MKVYNIILIGFAALVLLAMLHQIHMVSERFETNCTPNGTMLGRPSPDNRIRLYTQDECNLLNGNWYSNGECLKKSGGSYSAECSVLNTQVPVSAPAPVPVPVPVPAPAPAPVQRAPVPVQRTPVAAQRSPVAAQRSPVAAQRSPKRKSPKRSSSKRKSPKRKSPKRSSPKRKSPKRTSPKRSSSKRKSPKRRMSYSKGLQPYNKDNLPSVGDHPATKRLPSTKSRKQPSARELGPQIAIYL